MGGGGSKDFLEAKIICKAAIKGADGAADKEDKVMAAFKSWDKDGNGKISKSEITELFTGLNEKISAKQVAQLVKAGDKDKDGELDFNEITAFLFQAPHLQKFFVELTKLLEKHLKQATDISMKVLSSCSNPFEAMGQLQKKMQDMKVKQQAELEKKLQPILKKAIAWHDKDGSGVLEKDEAIIFFSNYSGFLSQFYRDVFKVTTLQTSKTMEKQMRQVGGKEAAQQFAQAFNEQMEVHLKALDDVLDVKFKDYKANIDDRHRAAWKVMDVNGDGNLNEAEILDCLLPSREAKHQAFVQALGLFVEPEDMGQPAQIDGDDEGCVQQ